MATPTPTVITVTFTSGEQTLAGTLEVPAGAPGALPAVLLLPGSGPVDRDSDHRRMPLGITRELSDALRDAGLVTLRYDKRGVGASPGRWQSAGFSDHTADARAALAYLRSRPEVDPARVVVLGHSEGALHAAALGADDGALAGVGLISGAARSGAEVLRWQSRVLTPSLPPLVRGILRLLRTDLERRGEATRAKIARTTTDEAWVEGARLNARWYREFMAHDPAPDLAALTVPVLALTGAKDLQVDPGDVERIAGLVPGPVEAHVVDDVNHILRPQPGPATLATYRKDVRSPLDARVVEHVVRWARTVVAAES